VWRATADVLPETFQQRFPCEEYLRRLPNHLKDVTINGWRFLIDCSDFPRPRVPQRVKMGRKIEQYRDTEEFRKIVLERAGWTSLNPSRDSPEILRKPWDEVIADCPIVNRLD
jgi:hypothetical protein